MPVARAIDDVNRAFPLIESIHILGMVLLAGTIVSVDLRVLGMAATSRNECGFRNRNWTTFAVDGYGLVGRL
jgi:hypothetical protein